MTLGLRWPPDTPPLTREPRNMPIAHLDRDTATGEWFIGVFIFIFPSGVKPP